MIVSDTTPLASPQPLVAWRPAVERLVQEDKVLNGIVVRPALLYGKKGSLTEALFASAKAGKAIWPGTPGGKISLIHCDDLADLYVRLAERAQVLGGLAFDAANGISESTDAILERLVAVSGASGYEFKEPTNRECWEDYSGDVCAYSHCSLRAGHRVVCHNPPLPCAFSVGMGSKEGWTDG